MVAAAISLASAAAASAQDIVISEIYFHPPSANSISPEPVEREFIELHNVSAAAVDVSGWAIDRGVSFTFPGGTSIPAGGYLAVAADVGAFSAAHPGVGPVVGGWSGKLSNSGERIRLADADGGAIDEVEYADEGEWSPLIRGPLDHGARGWTWSDLADGGGRSLELVNAALPNEFGQNWAPSAAAGGTPAAANSAASGAEGPLILEATHAPAVPRSGQNVTVSARLVGGSSATLHWRASAESAPAFNQSAMADNGAFGDGDTGDGVFGAVIPAQPAGTVIEFYITARDASSNERAWPAPTDQGQTANALFQFDDEEWTGAPCIYRIVLTKAEEAEFAGIDRDSDAMMNATFIARTDSGFAVRYRAGVRVRGASSRNDDPVPLRLSLPADRPWDGMTDFNLNTQFTWLQYVGMKLFAACDLPAPMVRPVQVRLNGTNGATGEEEQFGSYVHVQPLNGEFVDQAFPGAEEGGNLYKKVRPDRDWSYRNGNITAYLSDGWSKQTNSSENDWSDLNAFLQTMSAGGGNPNYQADVEAIADVTQWLRWFAAMTLLNNGETNLSNGADDDYTFYFRPSDGRLMLIPHDLDTILGQGDGDRITSPSYTLFDMIEPGNRGDVLDDLTPFFAVPAFRDAYYGQLRELARTVFAAEKFGPAVDAWLGGWVPPDRIATIKAFMAARTAFVLNQAEQILGAAPPLPAPTAASEWDSGSAPVGVRLNEVLALNRSAYANGGAFPDAVELFNAGAAPVDLGGWALTDDPETPAKFVFPANTMIGAGAVLVLNADAAAGAGIHLGFNLSAKGGALILYNGGGAQADRVDFGPQAEDFSVGRSSANPAIWRLDEPTIGFPNGPGILPAQLGDPALIRINEWSGSPNYRLRRDFAELFNPGSLPAPLGGARLTDDPAFGSDSLTLPPLSFIGAGQFAEFGAALPFGLNGSGDWLALIGENGVAIDRVSLDCGRGDWSAGRIPDGGDAIAHLRLPTPGAPNQAEIVSESEVIGWNYDWRYEDNNVPQSAGWTDLGFDDSGWAVGEGALGLEFESIPVPIQTQLNFRPPLTHYFRHTFEIADPAAGELFLETEIDDGAVVYVNGRELARLRMPSGAVGHSTLADGFVSEASIEGPFRVPPGWLVPGDNVIAAEVHQERADSSDIVFALRARFVESEPPNAEYARALALIDGLRISEIMFNPSGDQALEFIEIANVSMAALDLTGLRFEEGIQFTFPAMSLGAGEFLLVVRDAAAFAAEYGAGLPVAGEFTGALANGGELIRLELPGAFAGVAAAGFSYDDAWIPAADGGGASLVAARLTADPALWGEKASWKAGPIGGTPGNNGPPFFTNPLYATATQGAPFSFQLVAENGYSSWSVDDLPPGLSFNAATGIISGVPTGFGEAAVELNATNAAGTATSTLEIDIAQLTPPVITSAAAASGVLDEAFSYQITATNFPGSFDIGGQFPAGLSFDTNSGLLYGIPTEAGEFSVQVEASNIAGVGVAPVTITIQSDPLLASLETTLPLERGGDADWFAQSEVTHDGLDAARSGDIDDSEDSYMRAQIPGPDRLSFWWKVSSEQSFDYLDFRIDGVSQDRISGEVDWQEKLYDIPEGNHTIEWRFYKDGSVSDGDDAGYVDQVRLESDGGTPIIYSASRLGIFIGDSVDYQILATGNPDSITVENLPAGLQFNAAEYTITGTPENAGATTVLIRAENEAGEGTLGLLVEVFPEFNLGEALDWPSLRYRGNTDYLWFPSAAAFSFDGVDVARGGRPAEGEENWFEVDVEGPDTVVFWWRLLANSADSLSLFRDGELWINIYGATDWERVEVSIPEGTHTLRWSFRDEGNSGGNSANLALVDRFRLVSQSAEPFINSATAATAVQGSPFTYQIAATNDPATFGATGLPAGLSVDAATGAITGTPAATGVFTVTLTASNAAGSDQSRLSLSIGPPLNFNVPLDTVGQIYSGMPSGIQWSVTPTSMDGISAVSSGNVPADTARYFEMQVEGPETVSFWWNFTEGSSSGQMIFYRDGSWWNSMSSEQGWQRQQITLGEGRHTLRWEVTAWNGNTARGYVDRIHLHNQTQAPILTGVSHFSGAVGVPFSSTFQTINEATAFAVAGGSLPAGLSLDPATGVISGTPQTEISQSLRFSASNAFGTDYIFATLTIYPALAIAEAVDSPERVFYGPSGNRWIANTLLNHDGVDAARASGVPEYEEHWFETRVTGPDILTFWWRVQNTDGNTDLRLRRDNVSSVAFYGGDGDWEEVTYQVPDGDHTLRWHFRQSWNSNQPIAVIDQISFVSETGLPVISSSSSVSGVVGRPFGFQVQTFNDATISATGLPPGLAVDPGGEISGTPTQGGEFSVDVLAENASGSDTQTLLIRIAPYIDVSDAIDFPGSGPMLGVGGPASQQWFTQSAVTHDGIDAAQSGALADGRSSSFDLELVGPGQLSFWAKVSAAEDHYLILYRDFGFEFFESGEVDWTQHTIQIPAGRHTYRFEYTKQYGFGSTPEGSDAAWIDELSVTGYAAWVREQGVPPELANPFADPDGDSLNNLLEYALLGGPLFYDLSPFPAVTRDAEGRLVMSVGKNPDAEGLTLKVEVTGDLQTWITDGTSILVNDSDFLQVRDNDTSGAPRFIRLSVSFGG